MSASVFQASDYLLLKLHDQSHFQPKKVFINRTKKSMPPPFLFGIKVTPLPQQVIPS